MRKYSMRYKNRWIDVIWFNLKQIDIYINFMDEEFARVSGIDSKRHARKPFPTKGEQQHKKERLKCCIALNTKALPLLIALSSGS